MVCLHCVKGFEGGSPTGDDWEVWNVNLANPTALNLANPTALLLSAVSMLHHLDLNEKLTRMLVNKTLTDEYVGCFERIVQWARTAGFLKMCIFIFWHPYNLLWRIVEWLAASFKKDDNIEILKDKQPLQRLIETAKKYGP
ncbi:hypothetical protein L2E82_41132 [Cichorium intybus]|uniref:Uncharacterized protein n=1 Tax=Cichorium intybus TaxID=13427 RepID=A0ACB9APA3_CICIN|nr:hypothetical protein L2E82_41132 [Cichorium intybus]